MEVRLFLIYKYRVLVWKDKFSLMISSGQKIKQAGRNLTACYCDYSGTTN